MTWETILKAKRRPYQRKDYQGSVPHFFQFITRMIRPRAEQNEGYLKLYAAWDELEDKEKTSIVKLLTEEESWKADWPLKEGWKSGAKVDIVPGVTKLNETTLSIDNAKYNEWRNQTNNPSKDEKDFPPESTLRNKDDMRSYWQADWEPLVKKYRRKIYRDIKEILQRRRKVLTTLGSFQQS